MVVVRVEQPQSQLLGERSCKTCVHGNVCCILRGIAPLLATFERKPFEVEELAKVCIEYAPIY